MKSFTDILIESTEQDEVVIGINNFIKQVEKDFHSHFPNGYININYGTGGLTEHISGTFGMIGNLKDNTHGIAGNDKMKHGFIMFPVNKERTLWSFKVSGSSCIYIKPAPDSYNAMDRIKTKLGNNSKITLDKAEVKFRKFFKKLSDLMKENKQNIFGVEDIDKKYLVFK